MSKGTAVSIIIVISILVFVVSLYFYSYEKNQKKAVETEGPLTPIVRAPLVTESELLDDWETYINSEYGYSVKYPKDWYYKDYKGPTIDDILLSFVAFDDKVLPSEKKHIKILQSVIIMVENRSFEEAMETGKQDYISSPSEQDITISGVKAKKISGSILSDVAGKVTETKVLIPTDNKVYTLTTGEVHLPLFNKMLSSFRFTD